MAQYGSVSAPRYGSVFIPDADGCDEAGLEIVASDCHGKEWPRLGIIPIRLKTGHVVAVCVRRNSVEESLGLKSQTLNLCLKIAVQTCVGESP